MWSVLSIMFYAIHKVYVYSMDPFGFRWLKRYIYIYVCVCVWACCISLSSSSNRKSEVSAFTVVLLTYYSVAVPEVVVPSYSVSCFISIPRKLGFVSIAIPCENDWIGFTAHYTILSPPLRRVAEKHSRYNMLCQVHAVECVWKMKLILTTIFYAIDGVVCYHLINFSPDDRDYSCASAY